MSGSGREALPDFREWSEGPPGYPGGVGSPSLLYGSGREALPDVRKWSGGPPGFPGMVGRPSRMSGNGRKALPDVRVAFSDDSEWSGALADAADARGYRGGTSRKTQ